MTAARSDLALKPCPFCGGEPSVADASWIKGAAMIYCAGEECMGPKTTAASLQDAAVQWNTRAASQPDREAIKDALINARSSLKAFGGDPRPQIARHGEGDEIQAAILNGIDEALSLLSGAGTKSDGGEPSTRTAGGFPVAAAPSQAEETGVISGTRQDPQHGTPHGSGVTGGESAATLLPGPSDPSPGPDVREAFKSPIKCDACGKLYSDHAPEGEPVCECAARAVRALKEEMDAALTRPLGGFVQGSIADGGQCNEQSGKQPSPAWPQNLHPRTLDMVQRFAVALAKKLRLAEEKYGFGDGWADDHWEKECLAHFHSHIEKGDPLDVAAYCAFMWHHRWITYPAAVAETDAAAPGDTGLREARPSIPSDGFNCVYLYEDGREVGFLNGPQDDPAVIARAKRWTDSGLSTDAPVQSNGSLFTGPLLNTPSPSSTSATATETDGGEG